MRVLRVCVLPQEEALDVEAAAVANLFAVLGEPLAGRAVAQAATRPYGCSVKYGSAD